MSEALTASAQRLGPYRPGAAAFRPSRVLMVWAMAVIIPFFAAAGFMVAVDPAGYFRLNTFGTFGGDELFIKSSLMRHRPHNALLLGDSRAAFTDPAGIEGLTFFNAASGGASLADSVALLDRHDLEGVDLVVLMVPLGDITGRCGLSSSRLDDPLNPIRYGATFDALGQALSHLQHRMAGAIPDHRPDGTRYPDSRVLIPAGWDGTRPPRYLRRIAEAENDTPLHEELTDVSACSEKLRAMQAKVRAGGAEFLVVFPPMNHDLLQASGTDTALLREKVKQKVLTHLPFAVDFTVSSFSEPSNFPPRDATHFRPDVGRSLLNAAINQFCERSGTCLW